MDAPRWQRNPEGLFPSTKSRKNPATDTHIKMKKKQYHPLIMDISLLKITLNRVNIQVGYVSILLFI